MVKTITPPSQQEIEKHLDELAEKVFLKSIHVLGGLRHLAEFRTLTWLASLARAVLAVILKEEYLKSDEYIAKFLGLNKNTIRNILRADENEALERLKSLKSSEITETDKDRKDLHTHIAGGIAKHAYKLVKRSE